MRDLEIDRQVELHKPISKAYFKHFDSWKPFLSYKICIFINIFILSWTITHHHNCRLLCFYTLLEEYAVQAGERAPAIGTSITN
jgi:hypothetical protein